MLLLVTLVLGVASVMMVTWPEGNTAVHAAPAPQTTSYDVFTILKALFVKPYSSLLNTITPRLHLASYSPHF